MSHDLAIRRTFSGCFSFLKGRRRVYFAGNRYERAECGRSVRSMMQNNRERRNGMENILFSPPLQEAVALRML